MYSKEDSFDVLPLNHSSAEGLSFIQSFQMENVSLNPKS